MNEDSNQFNGNGFGHVDGTRETEPRRTGRAGAFADHDDTAVFAPLPAAGDIPLPPIDDLDDLGAIARPAAAARRRMIWPWILLTVVLTFAAAIGAGVWFFQTHALPGVTLWGTPVTGKTRTQIASMIDDAVDGARANVTYEDRTTVVSMDDLGLSVDSTAIADKAFDGKRDGAWWTRYAFWIGQNITDAPAEANAAEATILNEKLSIEETTPVDASVQPNADGTGFDVVPGQTGQGADVAPVAKAVIDAVETLDPTATRDVTVDLSPIDPAVTDQIAGEAKTTLDTLAANPVTITVDDHQIATIDAAALAASSRLDANRNGRLADGESRNGYVVFDSAELQSYYDEHIKPDLQTGREDREVIVNNNGTELSVLTEGHDGVTVADGADRTIGSQAAAQLAEGGGSIEVEGTVDPMQTKTTKRHIVVDLSDHKVYAYENDKLIRSMTMSAGQGNDYATGACVSDLCTPTGDFEIWLKYESQDMSGNLTLSDGSVSKWDVKGVGFVNYFSRSGCAIHRIATDGYTSDAAIAGMGNTSHGCVGIGWDQAEWFYGWALMGTSVHVQQ